MPHPCPRGRTRDDGRAIAERPELREAIRVLGLAASLLARKSDSGPELLEVPMLHERLLSRLEPPWSASRSVTLLYACITRIRAALDQDAL